MQKVILAILDGVGYKKELYGNAVKQAFTPNLDNLLKTYPSSFLNASGNYVGLPEGQMGNSEVGHMTIGSGRITDQPLVRINKAIEDTSFFQNEELIKVCNHVNNNGSKLHIFGLLSNGGIHSHINHILFLIKLASLQNVKKLYLHMFLDGRDTKYNSALTYLDTLQNYINEIGLGKIATIAGRYYAMDREEFYDRVKLYYDACVNNFGPYNENYKEVIEKSYENEEYDEFVKPTIINKLGVLEDNDGIIIANFRPDRLTETFSAITNESFNFFETKKLENLYVVSMTDVDKKIKCQVAFKNSVIKNTLGEVLSKNKYRVLRIAEVSKYPHVTHFFDGDRDLKLKGTTSVKVPKKDVETYDMYPKMSAKEVTDRIIKRINNFDFAVVNYANGDMVGHTGIFSAAKIAMEEVDNCIGRLYKECKKHNILLIITADHGNCEEMLDRNGNMLTTHTTNPVYLIVCSNKYEVENGSLKDIAPSILNILNIKIPDEMDKNIIINPIEYL